jgi:tripartite-type tricarboxylate transporter receptor subunit TctC
MTIAPTLRLVAGALIGALGLLTIATAPAAAQSDYPKRAIDMIVPFGPGGSTDNAMRLLGDYITSKWKVPVNVINKPGAKGIPQTEEVYQAAPDGYTLLADNPTTNTMLAAATSEALPYDVFARTFLGVMSGTPFTILVPADSPYHTLDELLAAAKADPTKISYTSQGGAGMADYFIRQVFAKAGVDFTKTSPVMVTGSSETVTLTAGGHVQVGLTSASGALSAVQGGLVRALLVSSDQPNPEMPDVPTSKQLGMPMISSWNGVSGPANMPPEVVAKWEALLKDATSDPEFVKKLDGIGAFPIYMDSKAMEAFVRNEIEEASKVFK